MRGALVATVGAMVLVAAAWGLAADAVRAGPFERPLQPVAVPVPSSSSFSFASDGVLGLCPFPPCPMQGAFELRLRQLPPVPYHLRLEGAEGVEDLGTHEPVDGVVEVRWSGERDLRDDRVVVAAAGRDLGSTAIVSATPLLLSWQADPDTVHVDEVGGVTVASVATARLGAAPPEGWEFRARLVGADGGVAHLGALDAGDGRAVLDGRAERVRLEDHDRLDVVVAPAGSPEAAGFPVLSARLWPERSG